MSQYRTALAGVARRFKRYPALARERGWEGVPEVSISFWANESGPDIELARSSGRTVLDDQAMDMIRRAVRETELPEQLGSRNFRILMPVQFRLEGD